MTNYSNKSPATHLNYERGGTIIGIIIGLIIGLAIALIVAVAITKSSLPFLNKVGKQDKAPELTAGQSADPNKPLYNNNGAAKEAAKEFTPATTNSASTIDGKPVVTAPASASAAPIISKPIDTKIADTSKNAESAVVNNAASAKLDNADDKWMYYLQAGAFREQADAENSKAKLALAGFEASISDRQGDTGLLYRVRIGPFNQLEAMNKVRGKLSDNGIDVAVVRIAK